MLHTELLRRTENQKVNFNIAEKEGDLAKVVEDLEQMKQFEAQRKYDIELVQAQYRNNLKRDYEKMDKFLEDK